MRETTRRRTVLAAGAAVAGSALIGCSEYGDESGDGADSTPTATSATQAQPPGGEELARTADIPVGGGKVFADRKIVVTQPEAGDFKAFSAVCTHQGCTVSKVADGTINCPCHGSKFSVTDAAVAAGPATRPLAEKKITVEGDAILLA
ncbi:Rieske (2Fe-2S) protein [Streptomyces sp. A3M-1-3]|uniref:Rieske (2Fe-2S) protein n=1 Tax=Streptomyces sp. A3M-1-3 TaxID=2962044 RepID=UPI0020B7E0F9|nr:Rieske (2Fe-2S) protein [Streptomyces sp. A3M-1-3]MCP3821960.1 Rieske (2Fe-2S) protein [Streptomyces sp. A3M-1-3]